MTGSSALSSIVAGVRSSAGLAAKADIAFATAQLGLSGADAVPVGDDCAAIPDGDGYLLLAIEGFMNEFVAADPWFAGWCGVMVNLADIAAMGGRPTAVVDAVWANGAADASPVLRGLRDASRSFGVPVVGGHTNVKADRRQLSVSVLGRARRLLTSFDAKPGEQLIAAIDLRGRYRAPFANWDAATAAPADRLRGDMALLADIAEAGLARAAKDISQGGLLGTAAMLAECSDVGIAIDLDAVPAPEGVDPSRWLMTFPSFGYLISAAPPDVPAILSRFASRGIAAAAIGAIDGSGLLGVTHLGAHEIVRDVRTQPLLGCAGCGRAA